MKLLPRILFIVAILGQCSCKQGGEGGGDSGAKNAADFQGMFKKFFSNPKDSSKAFSDFLQESGKKMGMKKIPGADPNDATNNGEDSDGGGEGDKDETKKPDEVPLPGKVFAFYGRTYGCTNSKVYQEFIKSYKEHKLPTPPAPEGDAETDDKWLKKLSKKDVDVTADKKPSVEEAEGKLKKLKPDQKKTLTDGESQMPLEAQMFLKFVKARGCQDKSVGEYKAYNAKLAKEIEANKDKKKPPPPSYYLSKAETILQDDPDLNKNEEE